MGFGGSSPPPPEPVPQVPQEDDPNSLEIERQAVTRAKKQDGYSKHLLSGSYKGDLTDPGVKRKSLIG